MYDFSNLAGPPTYLFIRDQAERAYAIWVVATRAVGVYDGCNRICERNFTLVCLAGEALTNQGNNQGSNKQIKATFHSCIGNPNLLGCLSRLCFSYQPSIYCEFPLPLHFDRLSGCRLY